MNNPINVDDRKAVTAAAIEKFRQSDENVRRLPAALHLPEPRKGH